GLLDEAGDIFVGVVDDRQLRIGREADDRAIHLDAGVEALVVVEAALLDELRAGVAGPPAAVLHPARAEVVLEGDLGRSEALPFLPDQAPERLAEGGRNALVRVQVEDPAAGGGLDRQVPGAVEVERARGGEDVLRVTPGDL